MFNKLIKEFKTPSPLFRSAPFWSWNDQLDSKELCYQVDMMQKGGFGGGFMHARMGLVTTYLSEEWFDCITKTVEYSKDRGFKAYIYDEDRCSSGFASGIVTQNPDNRMRYIKIQKKNKEYTYSLIFGPNTEWYNGSTYVDIINKNTVKDFMDSTYTPYENLFKKYFGNTIPAIFTDEPNYYRGNLYKWGDKNEQVTVLPWTFSFEKIFKETYGYDILKNVVYLVEEKEGYEKVRYDYFKLLNRLLLENFGMQVYSWCDERNIALTGHYMGEETLFSQVQNLGEAMNLYEYMHWPGIDCLGRKTPVPLIPKQCSSVANQLSKERVLSELYGCAGQDFSLADRKRLGDWNIVLGINFFCPHLYLYSLRGCRKRDYPPTISHHQPYWNYQSEIEDYFARTNFLMSQGEYCSNILVVHPVESAWCKFSLKQGKTIDKLLESGWNSKGNSVLTDIDNRLAELTLMLIENKFEYDFGSEHLIEKYGKIEDGIFTLENGKYSAVIIPDSITLRRKTVELLVDFGRAGGVLIASERFPSLMEGGQQDEKLFKELKQLCHTYSSLDSLMNILDKNIERFVLVKDANGENIPKIYVHTRRLNRETSLIFLTNITADKNYLATVEIFKKGALYKMNSFKGTVEKTPVSHLKDGKMGIDLVFPPVGSYMFLLNESEEPLLTKKDENKERIQAQLSGWDISMKDFNVLVLDRCAFQKSTDTRWSEKMLAIEVQNEMEKTCNGETVRVLFEFKVEEGFSPKGLKLIVESIDNYKVSVNGESLNAKSGQRWIDKCFNVVDIPANFIVSGKNSIILETLFNLPKKEGTLIFKKGGTELENIYIAGDFSVEAEDIHHTADGYYHSGLKLAPSQKITDEKSVNLQGYPFYTGILSAEKQVVIDKLKGRYVLQFEQFHCTVVEVSVNGRKVGTVYLPPYQIDLTGYLKEGTNIISIECAGTLRNALGPFHLKEMFPTIVGPDSFESFETEGYANVPFGVGKTLLIQEF